MMAIVLISLFAGIISAFVDNILHVATMLPVVTSIAALINCNPILLYFGLL